MSEGTENAKITSDIRFKPPLWMPPASVRAILAILAMVFTGVLMFGQVSIPDWWIASGSMIWGFYFKRA